MAIDIIIEAMQFTPGREPVIIQYCGKGLNTGPFAHSQLHHTTQADLIKRSGVPDQWGDAEGKAELAAHLAEHGISANVVDNVVAPQQPPAAEKAAP